MSTRNSKGAQFEITSFFLKKNLEIHKYSIYEEKNKFIKSKRFYLFVHGKTNFKKKHDLNPPTP